MAAIATTGLNREQACEAGFMIVTADAEGGMIDVHHPRPIVFSAPDAALWLGPGLSAQAAEQPARPRRKRSTGIRSARRSGAPPMNAPAQLELPL